MYVHSVAPDDPSRVPRYPSRDCCVFGNIFLSFLLGAVPTVLRSLPDRNPFRGSRRHHTLSFRRSISAHHVTNRKPAHKPDTSPRSRALSKSPQYHRLPCSLLPLVLRRAPAWLPREKGRRSKTSRGSATPGRRTGHRTRPPKRAQASPGGGVRPASTAKPPSGLRSQHVRDSFCGVEHAQ